LDHNDTEPVARQLRNIAKTGPINAAGETAIIMTLKKLIEDRQKELD